MKKQLLSILFLIFAHVAFSQSPYKYVIIPTHFPTFGDEFNPLGLSSELQKMLHEKSIESVFEAQQQPADYCEALTAHITKRPNMLKNKLKIELKDCINTVVWTSEGEGISKDFKAGYKEALAEALKELDKLPLNQMKIQVTKIEAPVAPQPQQNLPAITPIAENKPAEVALATQSSNAYKPKNLYWNNSYFIDLLQSGNEYKLVILNGKLLQYNDFQEIGTLTPSGLEGVYNLKWITAKGETMQGLAKLSAEGLNISLNQAGSTVVINLQKY